MEISAERRVRLIGLAAAVLAGVAMRSAIRAGWKGAAHDDPPENPVRGEGNWKQAAAFSIVTGLAVGLARLGGRAAATAAYERRERRLAIAP